jgi:AtzE family amidohydrolase
MIDAGSDAVEIAAAIGAGRVSARAVTDAALDRIAAGNQRLNAFTAVTAERARKAAAAIDAKRTRGEALGSLAGVPYAVKNLFDIAGVTTLAGAKIEAGKAPATADAAAVRRLDAAGAVLVGALNMDEYAYGFTTENAHYGPTRNPHDVLRSAGGSSGGCGAAVAGGLVPLSIGTDTNGSIRVPASLCGIFGLKPTYGRLDRAGAMAFVDSLDHVGPFARSVRDLALCYDALQGGTGAPIELSAPLLGDGIAGLRITVADGYFAPAGAEEAQDAVALVARVLGATRRVDLPESARARAAAFVISAAEGANLHLPDLRRRAADFDPATRDRFLAGALVPAAWLLQAQRFRRWYRAQVLEVFASTDVILAPATPGAAPRLGQETITLEGKEIALRPNLGLFTQPLSFIGLPVVVVPVQRDGALPIGVQIIAAPWCEAMALRVAAALEDAGAVSARLAG